MVRLLQVSVEMRCDIAFGRFVARGRSDIGDDLTGHGAVDSILCQGVIDFTECAEQGVQLFAGRKLKSCALARVLLCGEGCALRVVVVAESGASHGG